MRSKQLRTFYNHLWNNHRNEERFCNDTSFQDWIKKETRLRDEKKTIRGTKRARSLSPPRPRIANPRRKTSENSLPTLADFTLDGPTTLADFTLDGPTAVADFTLDGPTTLADFTVEGGLPTLAELTQLVNDLFFFIPRDNNIRGLFSNFLFGVYS
jgi:hypothetical protein